MANLTGPQPSAAYGTLQSSATALHALGTRMQTEDGRVFKYCQAGAVDLVAGNVIQAAAPITDHINCGLAAAAVGALSLTVTPGATGAAAGLYAGGLAVVSTGPNLGQTFRISGHPAVTASVAFALALQSDDPVGVAMTTASKLDLFQNLYQNVIQAPVTTLTGVIVGVAPVIIPATYYGWIQTWGPGAVLIDGTPAIANLVSSPASAAGAAAINSTTLALVGVMCVVGVTGKCKLVNIQIEA